MTENELRDLFREMRDEPVPADSIARVRMAVTERRSAPGLVWWKPVRFVFSLVCIALLALIFRPQPQGTVRVITRPPIAQESARERQADGPVQPAPQPVRQARRGARAHVAHREKPVTAPAATIRIETPDPDVVILLVGD